MSQPTHAPHGTVPTPRTAYEGNSRSHPALFPDRLPFSAGQSFSSGDFEEAQALLCNQLEERRVSPSGAAGRFDIQFHWQEMSHLKMYGAQWGVQGVRVRSCPLQSWHGILPLRGAMTLPGKHQLAGSGELLLFSPGQEVDVVWHAGSRAVVFALQGALLDEQLQRHHHTEAAPSAPFFQLFDRRHPGLASLLNLLRLIDSELAGASSLLASPTGQSHLQHLFCEGLLGLVAKDSLYTRPVLPGLLKRALDYIHDHLEQRIEITELVAVSGASRRSLEQAFRASLGTSPARYILGRRLLAIRERLLRDGEGEVQLAELAFRWGFAHPSHFTTAYKQAFGELPSQTLARRVSVAMN